MEDNRQAVVGLLGGDVEGAVLSIAIANLTISPVTRY